MALRDYGVAFSYHEMSNVGNSRENVAFDNGSEIIAYCNDRENVTYDVQTNSSEESYLLSVPSSPECGKLTHTKHSSTSNLKRYNRRSSSTCGSESSLSSSPAKHKRKPSTKKQIRSTKKKDSGKRARKGRKNSTKNIVVLKSMANSKISNTQNSRSKVCQNRDAKENPMLGPAAETKLFVPVLRLPKLKKHPHANKAKTSLINDKKATTTSILLSLMADAVSAPKYTSVHTSRSSTVSDYPEYPTRSDWPLLREMIAKPPVPVVSISPAARQTLSTVLVDPLSSEEPKANVISKLEKEIRCECKFNKGQPCWLLFQENRLRKERLHHLILKRESLDLVILAKIAANINREEKTKKYSGRDRQRCRVCYYHEGRQICRETFMFIHGICKGRLCALMQHYKKKGLSVRVHGNKSNVPHHALSYNDSERVLDFIREYANNHTVSSFGRKPGSKAGGGLLIMSPSQSKLYVHHKYKVWCSKNKIRAVSLRSFQNLWTKHLPYIVVLRGSNKNLVPEPGSQEAVLELHKDLQLEDELLPIDMPDDKPSPVPVTCSNRNINNELKNAKYQLDTKVRHVDCGTNTYIDFDSVADGRKKRKRKGLPPRKVESASCLSLVTTDKDFGDNHNFDDSQPVCASVDVFHDSLNSIRHVQNNSSEDNVIQNPPLPSDLHHSMFSNDIHIPQSISSFPLQDHPAAVMNFYNRPAATASVMLTSNKDLMYNYNNKSCVSMTKTANLQPSLFLQQSSQLLDSYTIQSSERFVTPISGSRDLVDQSQPVLLHHESSDFSNVQHIDWHAW